MGAEIDRLEIQIETSAKEANTQLDKLVDKLDRVQNALTSISGVSSLNGVSTGAKGAITNFNALTLSSNKLIKSSNKLTASFTKMYVGLNTLKRGFNALKDSVSNSMGYIENLNYFNSALGQVAEKADLSAWGEMGAASAEEYYNSFSRRAKELTSKMTGFNINDDGTLTATGNASLGIDPSKLMNYQAMFAQMSSSMGVASETSLKLSQALTEIGADLASVKNMDFDKVWTDMASGLAGMSRTLDKYGVNIRNVNLQQKLTELGINANVTALNQNDKALLRTIILLDSTRYAWGNLANEITSPANQIRLLSSNLTNLSRTIGNLFLPMVSKVLPYINGFVIALQRLVTWLGSLMGIDLSEITKGVGSSEVDIGGLLDETDGLGDSLDNASKSAKKLKSNLRGFDELNVITTQDDSGLSDIGSPGLASGLLDSAFDDIFSEYQAAWDKAFAEMENKAQAIADKIEKFFQPVKDIIEDFSVGDFFKAGQDTSKLVADIFNFFANAIDNVDWDGIGNNIGEFLEGIEWAKIFDSVGNLIWEGIQGAVELWKGSFDTAPIETIITTALVGMKIAGVTLSTPVKIGLSIIVAAPNIAKAIGEALGIEETIFGDSIEELSWAYVYEKLQEGFTNDSGNFSLTKGISFTLEVLEANVIGTAELLGLTNSDNPLIKLLFSPTENILRELPVAKWMNENIIQPIIQGGGTLEDGILNIWGNISSWWNNTAIVKIKGIPGEVSSFISELPGKIGYWLGYSAGEFTAWATDVTNYLSLKVPELIDDVGDWFEELPQKIEYHLDNVISDMEAWGANALSFVRLKVPEITDSIINFFDELPSRIFEIGENIMSGLWNGLQKGWSWIESGVTDFGNGIVDGFKDALDIHSPSRVMFSLGEFTMEGFQLGMENLYAAVEKSVGGFSTNLQYEIAAPPKFEYSRADIPNTAFPTTEYNNYSYYDSQSNYDATETNMLLRELISAVREGSTIVIDETPVFKAVKRKNSEEARLNHSHMLMSH